MCIRDRNTPLYGILEGCTQQPMHLVNRCAGKEPLLLLFSQFLLFALDIRTAGRFAQGRIEVFHVVGLEFLHLQDVYKRQDVERGERGSTEEHLTVTQFKVQREQERLDTLTAQIDQKEQQMCIRDS